MLRRTSALVASLGLALTLATACAGDPTPAESTPAFSSEEEAFAAAEETYRAYVDALNQVDLADPATFEPVFSFTTGMANSDEKKALTQMYADGWTRSGATQLVRFFGEGIIQDDVIEALGCVDVSEAKVFDSNGNSQTSADRPDMFALKLNFLQEDGRLRISSSVAIEDERCAES